ncbi:MAG: hypothetical protein E5V30_03815 [Mesorhizobium sp.]|nr:MAG: hypothetical protein E5V30_03815 [Mesorhizobium sp.]
MSSASHNSVRPSRCRHPASTTSSLALPLPVDGSAPAGSTASRNSGITENFLAFQPFDTIHLRKAADTQIVPSAISAQYFSMKATAIAEVLSMNALSASCSHCAGAWATMTMGGAVNAAVSAASKVK